MYDFEEYYRALSGMRRDYIFKTSKILGEISGIAKRKGYEDILEVLKKYDEFELEAPDLSDYKTK